MGSIAVHRRLFRTCLTVALLFLTTVAASAVKQAVQLIKPETAGDSGFSVKVKPQEDGTLEFVVVRDLSKARTFPPDSGLMTRRSADLYVSSSTGLQTKCELAGSRKEQTITYRFVVSKECVPESHLTIAEIDDYQDENREHLIGGGAFYRVRLADFSASATSHDEP